MTLAAISQIPTIRSPHGNKESEASGLITSFAVESFFLEFGIPPGVVEDGMLCRGM